MTKIKSGTKVIVLVGPHKVRQTIVTTTIDPDEAVKEVMEHLNKCWNNDVVFVDWELSDLIFIKD